MNIRTPNYLNCEDVNAPGLFIVLNQKWFTDNLKEISKTKGIKLVTSKYFIVNDL